MASECSGIRSGCGCERARAAGSGSRHRPRGGCRRSSGCLDQGLEASAITASARRNPQRRSPGASGSRRAGESGNLGSCRALADSPGCQDSRFSVPRPGGDLGGRDRGRGSAGGGRQPGGLETWNPGIRAARRGAGRRRPAVARSARVGRTRAAAMASPMARRRASRVPRGTRLRRVLARVLANACSTGNRSQAVGALHRGFIGCDVASAHIEAGPSRGKPRPGYASNLGQHPDKTVRKRLAAADQLN